MAKRRQELALIPQAGPTLKAQALEARRKELETCNTRVVELLDQYDATFAVTRIVRVVNGVEHTSYQLEVTSR